MADKKTKPKKATKKPAKKTSKKAAKPKSENVSGVVAVEGAANDSPESSTRKAKLLHKVAQLSKRQKTLLCAGVAVVILFAASWFVPSTKYAILNTVSSADASIVVIDQNTEQPVAGALVTLEGGASATTDSEGVAFFNDGNYGSTSATISKDSYETIVIDVTISQDDIVLGPFTFMSTGIPVEVEAVDWLSDEAIGDFELSDESGENVFASADGVAVVNVPLGAEEDLDFMVSADGYLQGEVTVVISGDKDDEIDSPEPARLVREGRHTFLSDRGGSIAFYSSNFDGSDAQVIVDTGDESNNFSYQAVPKSDTQYVALLASETLAGQRDRIALIDTSSGVMNVFDDAIERDVEFQFISVDQERVVYRVSYNDDRSGANKIKSYEFATGELKTINKSDDREDVVYDNETNTVVILVDQILQERWRTIYKYELSRQVLPNGEKEILTERVVDSLSNQLKNLGHFFSITG